MRLSSWWSAGRFGLAGSVFALALAASGGARAQDISELTVRTGRLENQVRQLSGQLEQLQHENRRLSEQLRKFQEDVEFRFNERGGGRTQPAPSSTPPGGAPAPQRRRNDAYDPAAQPGGEGAPRQLGGGGAIGQVIEQDVDGSGGQGPLDISGVGRGVPQGALPAAPRGAASVAAAGAATPRAAYEQAYAFVLRKEYEQAEMGFRAFLQSYPRDRLAADATYWLGESYFQRQRYREAAEQFLKVSRDYPRAGKGADSLLRLGMSLNSLGARDQACATYAKLAVDYPEASSTVRQGTAREQRRARCA